MGNSCESYVVFDKTLYSYWEFNFSPRGGTGMKGNTVFESEELSECIYPDNLVCTTDGKPSIFDVLSLLPHNSWPLRFLSVQIIKV